MNQMTFSNSVSALAVILVLSIFVDPDFAMAQPDGDTVPINSIRINGALGMNQAVSEAIRLLGTPDLRKDLETDAFGPMTELYYGQSRLAFIDGVLQEFEIRDSRLFLTLPAGIVSIGDDSEYLSELFPQSYAGRSYSDYISKTYFVLPLTDVRDNTMYIMDIKITIVLRADGKVDHIILEQPV